MRYRTSRWTKVAVLVGLAAASGCDGQTDPVTTVPPAASTHHALVSGTVLGQAGQPLSGVSVAVRTVFPDTTREPGSAAVTSGSAVTDREGRFAMRVGLVPGALVRDGQRGLSIVVLAFAPDPRFPRRPDGSPYVDSAQVVLQAVPQGQPPREYSGLRLTLPLALPSP